MQSFIRLHTADDVVIARSQLMSGASVEHVNVRGLIPPGHKSLFVTSVQVSLFVATTKSLALLVALFLRATMCMCTT